MKSLSVRNQDLTTLDIVKRSFINIVIAALSVASALAQTPPYIQSGSPDFYQHQTENGGALLPDQGWCWYTSFEDAMYYDSASFPGLYTKNPNDWLDAMNVNLYNIIKSATNAPPAGTVG